MIGMNGAEVEASDLHYVPPPASPLVSLHPSRMSPAHVVTTAYHAARPDKAWARLREQLCEQSRRGRCLFTVSGRSALRLALRACGVSPGSEVVLSTFNCPAVADAVLACGAIPTFVDFDPDTGPAYDSVELAGRVVILTNGLGLDEWDRHAQRIIACGGRPVLDLAQAIPVPTVLRRYAGTDHPIVLSFGEGKPLGGLGGGALLVPEWRYGDERGDRPAQGRAALARAVWERALMRAPQYGRAMVERRRRRAPGWSHTKADHLATLPGPVPSGAPDRWQLAAVTALLDLAEDVHTAVTALHRKLRLAVSSTLRTCRMVPSVPGLSPTIDLVFDRRGDRMRFARELAAYGVPSTWNYFPLHCTPAYARPGSPTMSAVERLWPRVLSLPKQPQPRLTVDLLARAMIAADRAVLEEGARHG